MFWSCYEVKQLPDLELAKYQSLGERGVEGVIKCHNSFLRQWQRNSSLLNAGVHFVVQYSPDRMQGQRIGLFLCISADEQVNEGSIDALVMSSALSNFYSFTKCNRVDSSLNKQYSSISILKKQERKKSSELSDLYTVHGWKADKNARLYEMVRVMMALNKPAAYCVSLFGNNIYERASKSLERPISLLRARTFGASNNGQVILNSDKRNAPRDFAAEDTLKVYEDFIKDITKSPCFTANIRVLSDYESVSRFILDAASGESIEEGDCEIFAESNGPYTVLLPQNSATLYNHMMPEALAFWPTLFTLEEISPYFRFPALYDGEDIDIRKETYPILSSDGLYLGKTVQGYSTYVNTSLLKKHAFICGVPGSGKTNTMLHIADALWHNNVNRNNMPERDPIPFLVLEPAKREYRELSKFDISELVIFSPSANTKFPLRLNPFEFPIGLTLSEHISKLCQVFEGAFPIAPPAPFILDRAIENIYLNHGWSIREINTGLKEYPTTSELYEQFEKEMKNTTYDSEIQGNIRSVLEMRIGSLLRREMKDIFDAPKSTISPEEWLYRPAIIELEALGEGPANFVTLLLCTLIRESLKVSPLKDPEKEIRHIIFIEEAHNLIAPQANVENGQDSNPKLAATSYIVKMLAEVRALREGIIIADQLPTAMAPEVIKNTNIKLVHRLTSGDDRELIGSTMAASGVQLERVATYQPGEALMSYEGLLRPFELRVVELKGHGSDTPNDDELYDIMIRKPAFFKLCKDNADIAWNKLKSDVKILSELESNALLQLSNYVFQGKTSSQVQLMFEEMEKVYFEIKIMRSQYCHRCDEVPEMFYPQEKKATLKGIISGIGEVFYKQLKSILQVCISSNLL